MLPESERPLAQEDTELRHDAIIQIVWRRRGIVFVSLVAALLAGVVYLQLSTPIFTSKARIYYQQLSPRITADGEPASARATNFLNTESEVIGSSAVLAVALGKPQMQELDILTEAHNPIRALKNGLNVQVGTKDDIITVTYDSPNRFDAQTIVSSIVEAYQTFQSDQRREALARMDREREEIENELAALNAQMLEFNRKHSTLSFDDENNPVFQRLETLTNALTTAHLETLNAKSEYEEAAGNLAGDANLQRRLDQSKQSGVRSVGDPATLRNELFNLEQRLVEAERQYGPNHPLVSSIQARLDHLAVSYVAAARERWLAADRRQAELENALKLQNEAAIQVREGRFGYTQLQEEAARLQILADEMAARTKALHAMEGAGALNITVLESADLPDSPSRPRPAQVMAVAAVGGMLLGLGLAFVTEGRDRRLRSPEEVKSALRVPVLGIVPAMERRLTPSGRGMKVHLDPGSDIAEAYRTVRTAVYFGLPDDSAKTILITSPSAGDGKSTLVSNLAIAMAQAGRRVLIVDADFRLPTQHKIFELQPEIGLTSALSGKAPMESAIIPTGVENLDLLPCGSIPSNPSEILNSQGFSDLLGDLAARYDHVVLDSPALMAVADARIASAWCDATLLVLHAEKTDRQMAVLARDGLIAVGANLAGVIVNDVDPGSRKHSFYTQFGYGGEKTRQPAPHDPWEAQSPAVQSKLFAPEAEPLPEAPETAEPPVGATDPFIEPSEPASSEVEPVPDATPQKPMKGVDAQKLAETSERLRRGFEALR